MARAGLYREQIQLVSPGAEQIPNGLGGFVTSGEDQKVTVWARIQQLKGAQLIALGKDIQTLAYKITVRYHPSAFNADRVIWKSDSQKVISLTSDEKRTEITIYTVSVS